jgi:predicted nuclease of restriction endonuclease-like (RecB) superfamily
MESKETQNMMRVDRLFERISTLIEQARRHVSTTVNLTEVYTKYEIGRYIIEDEQQGQYRAQYGKQMLKGLSGRLTDRFGDGWSAETLKLCRRFFVVYSDSVTSGYPIQPQKDNQRLPNSNIVTNGYKFDSHQPSNPQFTLSWSHYLILMRVKNPDARSFYEIETSRQQWSKRQLQRQIGSSLYERLALSRDKDEVMRLAKEGQTVEKPSDVIKDPLTLEFLGLKPDVSYSESKLENAIISRLQEFLLEMGKGFLFEGRQKRFTFEERHFYVDIVLYNRLLQCYVLVDLKLDDLTHQDLGQMQMYVNYYDRYVRLPHENPTIGILLCKEKNDALVELTLPKDANIYATEYSLYLPDKALLQRKLKEWIDEYNELNPEEEGKDGTV